MEEEGGEEQDEDLIQIQKIKINSTRNKTFYKHNTAFSFYVAFKIKDCVTFTVQIMIGQITFLFYFICTIFDDFVHLKKRLWLQQPIFKYVARYQC